MLPLSGRQAPTQWQHRSVASDQHIEEVSEIAFTALVLESQVKAAWEADSMGFRG